MKQDSGLAGTLLLWTSSNCLTKIEIVPDPYWLEKMKQKSDKIIREFSYTWRKKAARVWPPKFEIDIVKVLVRVQESEYYDRIMLIAGEKFVEIVKVGETIDDGLKIGNIVYVTVSPGSSSLLKNKKEHVFVVSYEERKKPRRPYPTKVVLDPHEILTRPAICKLVVQIVLLQSAKNIPPHTKIPPPSK